MSSQKGRTSWQNDFESPFTSPFHSRVPGPGHYQKRRRRGAKGAARVPFNSTAARESAQSSSLQPGPGAYIDISNPRNSSVMKGMLKFASDRVITEAQGVASGPFGSTEKRFRPSHYKDCSPGPGEYPRDEREKDELDKIYEKIARPVNASKSSMFSSKTDRFNSTFNGDPFIYHVGGSRHSKHPLSRTVYPRECKAREEVGYYGWVHKAGFNTTAPRWKQRGVVPVKSPGPGDYFIEAGIGFNSKGLKTATRKRRVNASTRADYFRPKTGTNDMLGPGYYKTETSMLKRTFNMFLDGRRK